MDGIAWDHSLETGHAGMDAEHRELADLFNQLRDAVQSGAGRPACARIFDKIITHTKSHFEHEQRMMALHRYPKFEQHAAEHAMLMRQARDCRENLDVDSAASRLDLMLFADVWLAFHILFSDKELARYLIQAGEPAGGH
jgi:hemerythrin-like metal-binding protein